MKSPYYLDYNSDFHRYLVEQKERGAEPLDWVDRLAINFIADDATPIDTCDEVCARLTTPWFFSVLSQEERDMFTATLEGLLYDFYDYETRPHRADDLLANVCYA